MPDPMTTPTQALVARLRAVFTLDDPCRTHAASCQPLRSVAVTP